MKRGGRKRSRERDNMVAVKRWRRRKVGWAWIARVGMKNSR